MLSLLIMIPMCMGFIRNPTPIMPTKTSVQQKTQIINYANPPKLWDVLSTTLKDKARSWFIQRAEDKGINWKNITNTYKNDLYTLNKFLIQKTNSSVTYPSYYTRPFHGYDNGNLNWLAALEGEAATLSMAVNYWKGVDPTTTETWLRVNISQNIQKYIINNQARPEKEIMDIGCSVGISTEYLYKTFPLAQRLIGVDLSPYFISIASYRAINNKYPILYLHANAEDVQLKKKFDLIVCNFILHEVPSEPTKKIIKNLKSMLNENGVLAVVDLDPSKVQNNLVVSTFRKWAFEVTEPHIYEYYSSNMTEWFQDVGFKQVEKVSNDPINSIWMGINRNVECCEEEDCDEDCDLMSFRERDIVQESLNRNEDQYRPPVIDISGRGQLADYVALRLD